MCRFVIIFLPRSKHLLIHDAVTIRSDFGAQENKVCQCFHCFPFYLPWSDETRCNDLSFLNAVFWFIKVIAFCSTKRSRSKANRVLPRERTGHSKHPLPTTLPMETFSKSTLFIYISTLFSYNVLRKVLVFLNLLKLKQKSPTNL